MPWCLHALDAVEGQHRLALGQAIAAGRVRQALAAKARERRKEAAFVRQVDHLAQGNQRILQARRDHAQILGIHRLEPQAVRHLPSHLASAVSAGYVAIPLFASSRKRAGAPRAARTRFRSPRLALLALGALLGLALEQVQAHLLRDAGRACRLLGAGARRVLRLFGGRLTGDEAQRAPCRVYSLAGFEEPVASSSGF